MGKHTSTYLSIYIHIPYIDKSLMPRMKSQMKDNIQNSYRKDTRAAINSMLSSDGGLAAIQNKLAAMRKGIIVNVDDYV